MPPSTTIDKYRPKSDFAPNNSLAGQPPLNETPFTILNWKDDPHWMVKSFWNYVCQQDSFLDALDQITQRNGYTYNEEFFFFPDPKDPDPTYHFEGVQFGVGEEDVTISEVQCWEYVHQAARFHVAQNKSDAETIERMLARIVDR